MLNILSSLVLALLAVNGALAQGMANCEDAGQSGIGCLECSRDKIPSADGKSCLDCPNNCDRCAINHDRGADDPQTICERCEDGYYKNSDGDCIECMLFCDECDSADKCKVCSRGTYLDKDKTCKFCPDGCPSCSNGYSCDECPAEYTLSFLNVQGGPTCDPCGAHCKYCQDNTVCAECDDYFYLDKDDLTCKECPHHCPDCKSLDQCDQCDSGYEWDSNNNHNMEHYFCIKKCLLLHDNSADSNLCSDCTVQDDMNRDRVRHYVAAEERCIFCPPYCDSCGNDGECGSCQVGYYIDDDGTCTACNSGCLTCTNADHCTSCAADAYEDENNECQDCPSSCQTCDLNLGGVLECSACVDGFYSDAAVLCEESCPSNCVSCTDVNTCISCKDGFTDGASECSDACTDIDPHCDSTCSKDGTLCDTCEEGWDGPTCGIECDSATECGECSGPADYECDECVASSSRYIVELTEASNAGSGFNDGTVCKACDYPTSDYTDANDAAFQKALDLEDSSNCDEYGEECYDREVAHEDSCTSCSITDCDKCAFIAETGVEKCIECASSYFVSNDGASCVSETDASCALAISDCATCYTDVDVTFVNNKVTAVTTSALKCASCDSNFMVSNDFSQCFSATGGGCSNVGSADCEDTYGCYLDAVGPTCTACNVACDDCDGGATTCSACGTGSYLDGTSCSSCTASDCTECDPSDPSVCLVCDSDFFLYHGTCRDCDDYFPAVLFVLGQLNSYESCFSCDNGLPSRGYLGDSCRLCTEHCTSCSFDETYGWEGTPTCDSCESGYYKSSDTDCTACTVLGANCITCECTTCDDGSAANDDKECLSCQDGFHGTTCSSTCPDNCITCDIDDGECNDCADGYTITSDGQCAACPAHCERCTYVHNSGDSYVECDECDDYYTQYNSEDFDNDDYNDVYCISCSFSNSLCGDGDCHPANRANYFSDDGLCDACAENCQDCGNAGAYSCDECIDTYRLTDPTCTLCPSNCAQCSADGDGVITCSTCKEGYYHGPLDQCELGSGCPANCASCTRDADGVICTECNPGKYHGADDNECTQSCTAGCARCTSADKCSECESGYCTKGSGDVTCISMSSQNCDECEETDDNTIYCISCQDNYHIDDTVCTACPSKCKECSIDSDDVLTCSECKDGYYHGSNTQCESGSGCPSSCSACKRDADGVECTECVYGRFNGVDKLCEEICPDFCEKCKLKSDQPACDECYEGYYDDLTDSSEDCKSCSSAFSNCGECKMNSSNVVICHECSYGYVLSDDGSECIACTDSANHNGFSNCAACSHDATNDLTCLRCDYGFILKDDGSACLDCDDTSADIPGVDSCGMCSHHSETCDVCGNGKFSSLQKDNCANLCYSCLGPDCENIVTSFHEKFKPSDYSKSELDEIVRKVKENLGIDEDDNEEDFYDAFQFAEQVAESGLIVFDVDLRDDFETISDFLKAGVSDNSNSNSSTEITSDIAPVLYCERGCVAESFTDSDGKITYRYGCSEVTCSSVDSVECLEAGSNKTCVRCCVGSTNRKVCNYFTLSAGYRIHMPITGLFLTAILAIKSFFY